MPKEISIDESMESLDLLCAGIQLRSNELLLKYLYKPKTINALHKAIETMQKVNNEELIELPRTTQINGVKDVKDSLRRLEYELNKEDDFEIENVTNEELWALHHAIEIENMIETGKLIEVDKQV